MSTLAPIAAIQIRDATPQDSEVCGRIFYDAFTGINRSHNFPPELPAPEAGIGALGQLFSHPGFYCVVAESEGQIVGSNCMDERCTVAGIGPVSVRPDVQDRGIGRLLMQAVMDRARQRGFPGIRLLQAAFHRRSLALYAKLGFDVREPMLVMDGLPGKQPSDGGVVRSAAEGDLDACNRICESVHGYNRSGELRDGINHGTAVVVERQGRISGYASGFGFFGHAAAESNADLRALLGAAERVSGPGIIIPARNAELFRWCLDQGMRVFQPMNLMTVGLYNEPRGAYLPSVLY